VPKIVPKLNALRAAQALVKKYIPADVDLVAELIADRRREVEEETKRMERDDGK
jgi:hypothetical protein